MNAIEGITIRGIAAAVPTQIMRTSDYDVLTENNRARFTATTGIAERRVVKPGQCSSDLCAHAADKLLASLAWQRDSVEALIFVSQSPDYPIPATAILLQDRLGLGTGTLAFDVNLGCSAYPYALMITASLMKSMGLRRSLLLVGDVSSLACRYEDSATWPLFGDAGTATALEQDDAAEPMHFDLHSDGSGGDVIIVPHGGACSRSPGLNDTYLQLRGPDVFGFAIANAPKSIQAVLQKANWTVDCVNHFVLHQANKMINDTVRKKVGYAAEKAPSTLELYGNTGSASIPLTLASHGHAWSMPARVALCGFGVGLSWGTATATLLPGTKFEWVETDATYPE